MMKVAYLFSALTLVAACGSDEADTNTDTDTQAISGPQHIADASSGGTLEFLWLAPEAVTTPNLSGSTFNNSFGARLTIDVLDLDCSTFTTGSVVYTFNSVVLVNSQQAYRDVASLQTMGLVDHHCYRVTPKLDNASLGYRDVMFENENGKIVPTGVLRWSGVQNQTIAFTIRNQFDVDGDSILNHVDACPTVAGLPNADPAQNGCPLDNCPSDPNKTQPGFCGCGQADVDNDGDGNYAGDGSFSVSCSDLCDGDASKSSPGVCGCGHADVDADGDLNYAGDGSFSPSCSDQCDTDALKDAPGSCGCNSYAVDFNEDGTTDACSNANTCTFN